ncbi:MAG: tetratricopeptide repeat protein [Verrucomicrobiota bacterium]|jgi:TPR repeat protein
MLKSLSDKFADFAVGFSEWGAGWTGKLSGFFRLAPLSSVLTRHLSKRPALLGVELLVALSLTVTFYFLVRPTCLPYRDGNTISRSVFCYLSEHVSPESKKQVQLNWKKRLAGPMLSAWLLDVKFKGQKEFDQNGFQDVFGFYHAAWLFLLFLLLILYRRDALWIILGVFGGLMYNLTDPAQPSFYYPWDLPTMFFFTLACLLYDSRRMWLLLLVVWLGGLFKETTLCCALLVLLGEHWSLKKRVVGFTVTVLATFAANKLLMTLYDVRAPVLAMNDAPHIADIFRNAHVFSNVNLLFSLDLRHVLFANAGSLLIMMLIPWRNRRDVVFKTMILVFIIGQFFCGIFNEFRIWYELLPLGWMMIADAFRKDGQTIGKNRAMDRRADRFWKGSYWLMLAGLLLLALGVLAVAKLHPPPPEEKNGVNRLSIEELISLAPKGDVAAQYNLGRAYENGFGVKKDPAEAAHWYQQAAEQGHSDAQNSLGMLLATARQDYPGAAQWFGRAAAQENPDAQYNLGVLHRNGLGVKQDYETAVHWFQKSAQQGHVQAQRDLGKMYERGQGVKPDYQEAYQWLKLAQLQGDEEAENELKVCAAAMSAGQIAAAEKLAREFRPSGK